MIKLMLIIYILTLFIYFFKATTGAGTENEISTFEYGVHILGEELSYLFTDTIPPFQPVFTLNTTEIKLTAACVTGMFAKMSDLTRFMACPKKRLDAYNNIFT